MKQEIKVEEEESLLGWLFQFSMISLIALYGLWFELPNYLSSVDKPLSLYQSDEIVIKSAINKASMASEK